MHFRQGYPSFHYVKKLYPELFINKDHSSFQCDNYALATHHKTNYPPRPYTPTVPFALMHGDVLGASRVSTLTEKRWFISITNDHIRVNWVFLLKEKIKVETIFKNLFKMIETKYNT